MISVFISAFFNCGDCGGGCYSILVDRGAVVTNPASRLGRHQPLHHQNSPPPPPEAKPSHQSSNRGLCEYNLLLYHPMKVLYFGPKTSHFSIPLDSRIRASKKQKKEEKTLTRGIKKNVKRNQITLKCQPI